jgi:hypothetical protein
MPLLLLALLTLGAEPGPGLSLKPGWVATSELKSPYATQAAAADDRFVYAVSNTAIAKYDRASGRLLGLSTGKAAHLNSAFVRQGKVYCAHSNYPQKPDQSEIKRFDPDTLELTTFHRFDQPPGSLTWCVHDGRFWWCCFAHYKQDNARTVLLQMTGQFHELARWTFPTLVVNDWGGMSASGGVWDGSHLLVIGHDRPALYQFRLPKEGTTLEFGEALACPFPGQGIAVDPKTGGLVGIDRKRQAIVFAQRQP